MVVCLVDGVGNVRLHTVVDPGDVIGIPHPGARGEIVPFVRTGEADPVGHATYRQRAWLDLDARDRGANEPWMPTDDTPELRVKVYIIAGGSE